MMRHQKIIGLLPKILQTGILVGPLSMFLFLGCLQWLDSENFQMHLSESILVFLVGSIFSTIICLFSSVLVYIPILWLVGDTHKSRIESFKAGMPWLLFIFIIPTAVIIIISNSWFQIGYALLISALLSAIVGWYILNLFISKINVKSSKLSIIENHEVIKS